jgi:hypothetical protein
LLGRSGLLALLEERRAPVRMGFGLPSARALADGEDVPMVIDAEQRSDGETMTSRRR